MVCENSDGEYSLATPAAVALPHVAALISKVSKVFKVVNNFKDFKDLKISKCG